MAAAAILNRPKPTTYQLQVKNIAVDGVRIPHIDDDDGKGLKLYAAVRLVAGNQTINSSTSFVAERVKETNHITSAEWLQTHLLTFNADKLEESKLYIDIYNDKGSGRHALIGSVCHDKLSENEDKPNGISEPLTRPGDIVLPNNGFIKFDVCVLSAEVEAKREIETREME